MCQRWRAIRSQFAMQSRSYYDCHEFEAKVQAKTIEISVPDSRFLVGVASYNCRGHFKQRFPKHLSAMSVLIGKKNILILRFTLDRKKFQTGLDPSEFTGELLRILSVIRVQQNKQKKENATVFPK